MSTVVIALDGNDITDLIKINTATFTAAVNGVGGTCSFEIRDLDHVFGPVVGLPLTLAIDGDIKWRGFVLSAARQYAFAVDDTSDPTMTERMFLMQGADNNILFQKRVVWNKDHPRHGELPPPTGHRCSAAKSGMWAEDTPTDIVVPYLIENYTSMVTQDGITFDVSDFGSPMPDKCGAFSGGMTVGELMADLNRSLNGVWYLTPTGVFRYHSADTVTSDYTLTDKPTDANDIGPRQYSILSDATNMINDALVWGTAMGWSTVNFSRARDNDDTSQLSSITDHGRWQYGEFNTQIHKQATVDKRADTIVFGLDVSQQGARWDAIVIEATTSETVFNLGDVVRCKAETYSGLRREPFHSPDGNAQTNGILRIDLPIRRWQITFAGPTEPIFRMVLTREPDDPFSAFESRFPAIRAPNIPRPEQPEIPEPSGEGGEGGCTDAICGITDTLNRTVASGFGTSDIGKSWSSSYGTGASSSVVTGHGSLVVGTGGGGGTSQETLAILTIPDEFALTFEFQLADGFAGIDPPVWFALLITTESGYEFHVNIAGAEGYSTLPGTAAGYAYIQANGDSYTEFNSPVPVSGVWHTCRLERNATTLSMKFWETGDPEPGSWTATCSADTPFAFTGAPKGAQFALVTGGAELSELWLRNLDIAGINLCAGTGVFDSFTRTVSAGSAGTSDFGINWNTFGTAANISVDGDELVFSGPAGGTGTTGHSGIWCVAEAGAIAPWNQQPTFTMRTDFIISTLPVYPKYASFDIAWYNNDGNGPHVGFQITSSATPASSFVYAEAGEYTVEVTVPFVWVANTVYFILLEVTPGTAFRGKVWKSTETMPSAWTFDLDDTGQGVFVGDIWVELDIDFINSQAGGSGTGVLARTMKVSNISFSSDSDSCIPLGNTIAIDDWDDRTVALTNANTSSSLWGPISSATGDVWVNGGEWNSGTNDVWYSVEGGTGRVRLTNYSLTFPTAAIATLNDNGSNYSPWFLGGAGVPDFLFTDPMLTASIDFMVDAHFAYLEIGNSTGWTSGDSPTIEIEEFSWRVRGKTPHSAIVPFTIIDGTWYTVKWFYNASTMAVKLWERGTAEPTWQRSCNIALRPWHNVAPFTGEFTLICQSHGTIGAYSNFYFDNFVRYTDVPPAEGGTGESTGGGVAETATYVAGTTWAVTNPFVSGSPRVSVFGVVATPGTDYTEDPTAGTITFDAGFGSSPSDVVYVSYVAMQV